MSKCDSAFSNDCGRIIQQSNTKLIEAVESFQNAFDDFFIRKLNEQRALQEKHKKEFEALQELHNRHYGIVRHNVHTTISKM